MQTEKTKVFIEKARAKHGDRYDYSKSAYARSKDKVIITCKEHGDFEQTPCNHLRNNGCAKCSGVHSYSTPEWIIEAKNTHGDRYDYSKTVYVRAHGKVTITCNEHGDFEQNPNHHLHGQGCAKCAVGVRGYSTPEWIIKAKNTHDGRYDYSKVVYVRSKDKVIITCRLHGDFEQIPSEHLKGHGCAKCSGKHNYSTHEWIIEAKNTHGDRYDYSKSVYARTLDKVVITCKEHGDFEQVASSHLRGRGCPRCFYDRDQPTEVYLMQMGSQVKIGISIDPDARLAELNRSNPAPALIITTWTLEDFPAAHAMEQRIHRKFTEFNAGLTGFDGATEWFDTTPEYAIPIIENIIEQLQVNAQAPMEAPFQQELMYG